MNGLVLTAGGARGAYQVGVLKRIGEIPRLQGKPSPFPIIAGASAGAINGAAIAAYSDDFSKATRLLSDVWSALEIRNVFKTDPFSLGVRSVGWLRDLSLGGLFGGGNAQSLLDFSPLSKYLNEHLSLEGIQAAIDNGHLYAVAISATNYYSGKSFTFIQGRTGHPLWEKSRRVSLSVKLNIDHICASCSIPIIFQPVLVETELGDFWFGDGGLRLIAPFSPAIRLGADRVFAIGIRSQKAAEDRSELEYMGKDEKKKQMRRPPMAQIFGIALNSIFLDHLDTDLEHLKRMNEVLASAGIGAATRSKTKEPMRNLYPFVINPSEDLAAVAEKYSDKMPRLVGYMMEGLGSSKAESSDLLSYLLFDSSYVKTLIDIGYQDAEAHLDEIEDFIGDGK